jgi:two-component system, OmpR family, sensor histidine kinase QseC
MQLNSLSLKVLLSFVAGMLLTISLVVIAGVWLMQSDSLPALDLADAAAGLAEQIKFDEAGKPVGFDPAEIDVEWLYESMHQEAAYRILDADGNVALLSKAGQSFWPATGPAQYLARTSFDLDNAGVLIHVATEPFEQNGKTWYLQFAASGRLMTLMYRFAFPLIGVGISLFGLILVVAFGLFAFITLKYTLKPLRDISQSAASISPRMN